MRKLLGSREPDMEERGFLSAKADLSAYSAFSPLTSTSFKILFKHQPLLKALFVTPTFPTCTFHPQLNCLPLL